jgi:hypothetical protein
MCYIEPLPSTCEAGTFEAKHTKTVRSTRVTERKKKVRKMLCRKKGEEKKDGRPVAMERRFSNHHKKDAPPRGDELSSTRHHACHTGIIVGRLAQMHSCASQSG